ncbi:MAG: glycosyltransferase family 4 protein, partial [Rhodospirillales bacterium]|nr:glycosyltransferase family 4 protein [Rhodospirillales bacterium]
MRIGAAVVGCHRRGGIERVALETVNALAARGHDVELVSYKIDQQAVNQRVRTHELTEPWGPRLRAAVAFPGKAERAFHDLGPLDVRCGFGSLSVPGSVVWVTSVHARWLEVVDQGEVAPSLKRKLNPFHPLMLRQERQQYAPGYHRRLLAMSPSIIDDLQRFCQSRPDDIQQLP